MSTEQIRLRILIAEDDKDDQLLCQEALNEAGFGSGVEFVSDGQQLMDDLRRRAAGGSNGESRLPDLILLDLNMPKKDGREALGEIKSDPLLKRIPVVVLTTSKAEADVLQSYDCGANSFVTKPFTYDGLYGLMTALTNYWVRTATMAPDADGGSQR